MEQILTIHSYTIGTVQQQHRMQERLARNQPTSLWALAPEPRRKERDPRRAAEDSQPAAAINQNYHQIDMTTIHNFPGYDHPQSLSSNRTPISRFLVLPPATTYAPSRLAQSQQQASHLPNLDSLVPLFPHMLPIPLLQSVPHFLQRATSQQYPLPHSQSIHPLLESSL